MSFDDFDTLKANFDKYVKYCNRFLTDENKKAFEDFLSVYDECLILCPASQRENLHLGHPGGLITHSINVLNSYTSLFIKDSTQSELGPTVTVSLLHDIGKLGTPTEPYYIEKFDGRNNYQINQKLKGLTIPERSLKILSNHGFHLTDDEYSAIANSYYFINSTNINSIFNLPTLAKELAIAKLLTIDKEKKQALNK
jgi:hypothetical protein